MQLPLSNNVARQLPRQQQNAEFDKMFEQIAVKQQQQPPRPTIQKQQIAVQQQKKQDNWTQILHLL